MAGLVADYGSDSESDSSDVSATEGKEGNSNHGNLPRPRFELPKPEFASNEEKNVNSVFVNPFVEEAKAKNAILEKHVKMISKDVKTLNGKQICWNYRKNKCRFGHNCKYAHDSDIQVDQDVKTTELNVRQGENNVLGIEKEDKDEDVNINNPKRKRPGLSQTLVPGKKVMKMYHKQKQVQH